MAYGGLPLPDAEQEILSRTLQAQAMQPATPEDFMSMMGQIYYLIKDDKLSAMVDDDKDMKVLLPAISPLLRTGNLDPKTRELMKLRWRIALRIQLMVMKNADAVSVAKFQSWLNHGDAAIDDTKDGWRGRLITERIKIFKVEMSGAKRRKLLGIF